MIDRKNSRTEALYEPALWFEGEYP